MLNFASLFGQHEVDEWRDEYTLVAAAVLNQTASDLLIALESELKKASWKDGLIGQSAFITTRVAPAVREVTEPIVARIIEDANQALRRMVALQAVWHDRPAAAEAGEHAFEGWQDIAVATGPLAGGAALAVALPTMAVTTTTAWFGLVSATAISWPVVLGGGAVAGVAVATGMVNTAKLWDRTEARLRRNVREYVVSTLIEGTPKDPSILKQIGATFDRAAELAKEL